MDGESKKAGVSGLDATAASAEPRADLDTFDPGSATPDEPVDRLSATSAGRYRIADEVGRGGLGRVLRARDEVLDRTVAIKELLGGAGDARRRFVREALVTARLQHPSIVPVYDAGRWKDQAPFYAMKLVSGRPLADALAEATTLEARLALLPTILAVADAIAYAHGERIIHRDLKPGNVLVGSFGETVVIDWGLAKDLSIDDRDALDAGPYREAARADETVAGVMMGTPAYMAPEQAAGEDADERADVYALGAMLYHLVAGVSPHRGNSMQEVISRVICGDVTPLVEREPRAPADLAAIVSKAMALEPGDRYPSARELAEDLRRFQTGQLVGAHRYSTAQLIRRWARRHRAPLAVAAVLLAISGVFAAWSVREIVVERNAARAERARAEQRGAEANGRRIAAEKVVDYLLFELRGRLRTIGRLDVLAGLGASLTTYYETLAEFDSNDRSAIDRHATTLSLIGEVYLSTGDLEGAERAYRQSQAFKQRVLDTDPANPKARRNLALGHENLGKVARGRGDLEAALAEFRQFAAILEELVAEGPDEVVELTDAARAHSQVGGAISELTGAADEVEVEFKRELELVERVLRLAPDDPLAVSQAALAYQDLGDLAYDVIGDPEGALPSYQKARELRERAAAMVPDDLFEQGKMTSIYERLGVVNLVLGNLDVAQAMQEKALAIQERLLARDPEELELRRDSSVSHNVLASIAKQRGDLVRARREYQLGLDIMIELTQRDPRNLGWLDDLGVAYQNIGLLELDEGHLDAAQKAFESNLAINEKLLAAVPSSAPYLRSVGIAHERFGDLWTKRGKLDAALAAYQQEVTFLARAVAAAPKDDTLKSDLSWTQINVGDAALRAGRAEAAALEYRAALAVREDLATRHAGNAQVQSDLAEACEKLANALGEGNQEATTLLARAVAIRKGL